MTLQTIFASHVLLLVQLVLILLIVLVVQTVFIYIMELVYQNAQQSIMQILLAYVIDAMDYVKLVHQNIIVKLVWLDMRIQVIAIAHVL